MVFIQLHWKQVFKRQGNRAYNEMGNRRTVVNLHTEVHQQMAGPAEKKEISLINTYSSILLRLQHISGIIEISVVLQKRVCKH